MRLGQLARKLSLRPSQVVDFLAAQHIETEEGSNTRIDDVHVEQIVRHFAPERLDEIFNETPADDVTVAPLQEQVGISEEEIETEVTPEITPNETQTMQQPVETETQAEPVVVDGEVIRVQKVELAGLKVLGKIELPEPKKKEPVVVVEGETETQPADERRERRTKNPARQKNQRNNREQRAWQNPLEVQRQREAREQEEKRLAELEREKEKRKRHYHSKVKQAQPKAKRTKGTAHEAAVSTQATKHPTPKTWFGKFLRWWTT